MGWDDCHLHEFETINPKTKRKTIIGMPEEEYQEKPIDYKTLPGWKISIKDYLSEETRTLSYLYDFGDGWNHQIEYERIMFKQNKQKYPLCIAGESACPPEDCGGPYFYEDFLKILNNPLHKDYKQMNSWVGKKFDPIRQP